MLTFGVVGSGAWGSKVIKAIRALGYDVSVCNRSGEYEDQAVCRDYKQLIPHVDIVWVATHPSTNCEIAAYAIEHGKPTVVEKPVAFTSQQVAKLVRLSKARQVSLIVDYIYLFNAGLMTAMGEKRPCCVASYGELTGVTHSDLKSLLVAMTTDVPERDYSALWDMGSHAVAIALDAFQGTPITNVSVHKDRNYGVVLEFAGSGSNRVCTISVGMNADTRKIKVQLAGLMGARHFRDDQNFSPLQAIISKIARLHLRNEYWSNGDLAVEVTDVLERLHKLLPKA